MSFEIDFVKAAVSGEVMSSPHKTFVGYSTDNRDPRIEGKIFIPLVGESHDAHKYVEGAVLAGATGILYHQWDESWEPLKSKASFIEVGDTLVALQDFAKAWRKELSGKVLALTGSNGKTTTKDFLFQILKNFGNTQASQGSFNNHWGVPFTLLDTKKDDQFCVVEMGMNHSGEISKLMSIADPDLVTVTNVGRAHMGNFDNDLEGVAKAKEEIYESAKAHAQLLFNIDSKHTREMYKTYMDRPSYTYSNQNFSADVYLKLKSKTETGMVIEGQIGGVLGKCEVHFWGEHNIQNLAAAVTMAYISGCKPEKLWTTLGGCNTGWGRNQWLETQSGAKVLFDGYNANPDSFKELINNVEPLIVESKKGFAIFGEMLELGEGSASEHRALGELAGKLPWDKCLFIGPSGEAFLEGWKVSENANNSIILNTYKESLDLDLLSMVDTQSLIIVKGSRGGALERIVERFQPVSFPSK